MCECRIAEKGGLPREKTNFTDIPIFSKIRCLNQREVDPTSITATRKSVNSI